MRGIDRVIAVILLVGAVGGAAAFARHSGSESTARGVHLAAPPLQHVEAPGTVLIAPTPAPIPVQPAHVAPARRVTTPQATLRRPVHVVQPQKQVQPPVPKPAPAPVEAPPPPVQAPPTPIQAPEPPRALAVVQPASVQPEPGQRQGKDHGHARGDDRHDEPAPVPEPPVPAPADIPVAPPLTADSSGTDQGNGNDGHGNGNGNDHGHGSGDDQGGGPRQAGD